MTDNQDTSAAGPGIESRARTEDAVRSYIRDEGPEGIASVYLFGSAGRARRHRESDIDVGVLVDRAVFPAAADRARLRVDLTSALIGVLHENQVDLVILNDVSPELGRGVVTHGRPVIVLDAEADHAFVRDVQLRAADLDIFLRRMRRIKLEALRS